MATMTITASLFEAFLKCPSKCYLRSLGKTGAENAYADWVRDQSESYHREGIKYLIKGTAPDEFALGPIGTETLGTAKWRLSVGLVAFSKNLESSIHIVERVPSKESGQLAQFIPIRFFFTNKLIYEDKLILGFDAFVLSEMLGREVGLGKIIHGDKRATLKVKTSALMSEVRKLTGKIATLLSSISAPDPILSKHCAECEFQTRCRQKAVEADDLSLLSGMREKERSRHRSKGIFTVNQLSYTFRPRRRPKRTKNLAKPHYSALKALSIREHTVYIHGSPQLPDSSSKIYLDIEGLPDGQSYYLVGALVVSNGQETFHSFWADQESEEPLIFTKFVEAVCQLPDFGIFHYGNYETTALKRIRAKFPELQHSKIDAVLDKATNVLSVVHPHIYFPTYSNGLKDIGCFLGYERKHESTAGLQTIVWRKT